MKKMPVIFIGHGSPMNAIEENVFTKNWAEIAAEIPKPEAILAISAHWYTRGSKIMDHAHPRMIYDMYGFPKELYEINYPAPGSPDFAYQTRDLISREVEIDNTWGFDHGTWSVLVKMFPKAEIPVFQLSVDQKADVEAHFKIGQEISQLRKKGVLILTSGNVVHNLTRVNFSMEGGYDWAYEFDNYIRDSILKQDYAAVLNYKNAGKCATLSFPTPDHFYPLLYALGASNENDQVSVSNHACIAGSLSMTCYTFK